MAIPTTVGTYYNQHIYVVIRPLRLLGTFDVNVQFRSTNSILRLIVAAGHGPSLLGRNWFKTLGISVSNLHSLRISENSLESRIKKFSTISTKEFGEYKGPVVSLDLDDSIKPRFLKCRPIPFALRDKVNTEIQRLVDLKVLEPIPYSRWATPLVIVEKTDGSLRMCGDYRSTVNQALRPDKYPLPRANEAFASLSGGTIFSKIDLEQAYTQVKVDTAASEILTLNTPKGLHRVLRLPFGISAAPGIFQRLMENTLAGIPGIAILLDDILVSGKDPQQHEERLFTVLQRLSDAGLRIKKEKSFFGVPSVTFIGFRVDSKGIHPLPEKVEAIHKAPAPKNKTELQALLGLINFYERFLRDKATILEPLHRLLDKKTPWTWSVEHEEALQEIKNRLTSDQVLTHYDGNRPLVLACDASSYGVGVVLSHTMDDGLEAPIAFASRTLSKAERNYAQLDREALSVMFGIQKFHQYVYGRKFKILTDHEPLLGIFCPRRAMPITLSPRMLRWSLILGAYSFEIQYIPGKLHNNADFLSRLPLPSKTEDWPEPADIYLLQTNQKFPISAEDIATGTQEDQVLSRVFQWTLHGWPQFDWSTEDPNGNFSEYRKVRLELSLSQNCILRGNRIIIPSQLRNKILQELHTGHHGIVHTKKIARSYVWWPHIDKDIEELVKSCNNCQEVQRNPPKIAPQEWTTPTKPWSRIHIDYAGPFQGQTFLILIDAFSKWPEIKLVSSMSTNSLIRHMRDTFAVHGVPDTIVSDNGPQLVSKDFEEFLSKNGIQHVRTAPYHPSSNGLAERTVQTFKQLIRKYGDGDWNTRLARVLFAMRSTPNSSTGSSPAELLMKRKLQSPIDKMIPKGKNQNSNSVYKNENDKSKTRDFKIGDLIYMRLYLPGQPKWTPGTVTKILGSRMFEISLQNGQTHRRHIDQLIPRKQELTEKHQSQDLQQKVTKKPQSQEMQTADTIQTADVETSATATFDSLYFDPLPFDWLIFPPSSKLPDPEEQPEEQPDSTRDINTPQDPEPQLATTSNPPANIILPPLPLLSVIATPLPTTTPDNPTAVTPTERNPIPVTPMIQNPTTVTPMIQNPITVTPTERRRKGRKKKNLMLERLR